MKLTLDQINALDRTQLTQQELMYLRLRVFFSVAKIAEYNGVSRQWVNQIVKSAEAKVARQLNVHA